MVKHFESIWEDSENYYKESSSNSNVDSIITELLLKVNLYNSIDQNDKFPEDQKKKIKLHTFGEMLMTLTQLSLKDNINSYAALVAALQYKKIEDFGKKY